MTKKCPPGVFCIENLSLFLILLIVIIISYLGYNTFLKPIEKDVIVPIAPNMIQPPSVLNLFGPRANYGISNAQNDVLLNPYVPPLRDDRYIPTGNGGIPGIPGIPINISTQAIDTTFRQVGILTRINGKDTILPLMGRPLFTNRDKWQFYTISEKNNFIKLPITFKRRSCMNEYGCDNIYNNDSVYVEGYKDAFKATIYDNAVMKYIPFV